MCCGAIVFAGAAIGAGAIVGDQAYVRERAVVGEGTVIGRGSAVNDDVVLGARVRVQTGVYLTAFSAAGGRRLRARRLHHERLDDGPSRPGTPLRGATLRRACRIGGGAVLCPGVEVGGRRSSPPAPW